MKRIAVLLVVMGLVLALVIGCGDDDEVVAPDTKETGELTDPGFLMVLELLYGSQDFSDSLWVFVDDVIDTVFEDSASLSSGKLPGVTSTADVVELTYHETSQYWYLYIQSVDTVMGQAQVIEDIITAELEDSIQFRHGETIVQWPDSALLTSLANGAILTITTQSGLGNVTATQNVTVAGEIVDRGDVVIDGARTFDLEVTDEGGSCSAGMDVDAVAYDVELNVSGEGDYDCPYGGTLSHAGTITIECTGDTSFTFTDTWIIVQYFYTDSIVVHVENTTTEWDFVDYCDGQGPVTKRFDPLLAAIRPRD